MEIKLFYCSFCAYKTKRKYDLNRHEIALHSKNILNECNEKNNINLEQINIYLEKNNIHFKNINNKEDINNKENINNK